VSAGARLADLIAEFKVDGQDDVLVPITQSALAERWGISAGSVQDFLRRNEQSGTIVSRSPLIIRTRPPLRLVSDNTSVPAAADIIIDVRTAETAEPAGTGDVKDVDLVERCLDLMIDAAAAGDLDLARALKAAALTGIPSADGPIKTRVYAGDRPAQTRANPRESAQTRVLEEEIEKKTFSSGSLAADFADAVPAKSAGLPKTTISVVTRRLAGKDLTNAAECTPAWKRSNWSSTPRWDEADEASIGRYWHQKLEPAELTADALAALQLWPPADAAAAIDILAARTNTRNHSARMMDAAVWGYHSFFPPTITTHHSPTNDRNRLERLSNHLQTLDVDTLMLHLESCAEDPDDLKTRTGLALHLGLITTERINDTQFMAWMIPDIEHHARHLTSILEGDKS